MTDVELPFVSIVIPARNEAHHLASVLANVAALDYPPARREVIVVDNGSTDDTVAVARRGGARVIDAPEATVGEVRNAGARAGTGDVVAFLDADCLAGPRWLRTAVERLSDPRVGAVGGNCTVPPDGNWVQRAWVVEQGASSEEAKTLATASFILRRRLFVELGGFDPTLGAGEDDDLSLRVRGAGYRLLRVAECGVVHLGYPSTLWGVMRRQWWHGRSQLRAGGFDPMVLLTHLFGVSLLVVLASGVAGGQTSVLLAFGGTIVAAALPAWRKEHRAGRFDAFRFAQRVAVYWWFLLGRSGGLVLNYFDRLGRRVQPLRADGGEG